LIRKKFKVGTKKNNFQNVFSTVIKSWKKEKKKNGQAPLHNNLPLESNCLGVRSKAKVQLRTSAGRQSDAGGYVSKLNTQCIWRKKAG